MTSSNTYSTNAGKGDADQPLLDLSGARMPTARELGARVNPVTQLGRFTMFALRLTRMVLAGHH